MTILVIPWFGCNLRCAYCFSRNLTHHPEKQKLQINYEAIRETLRKLVKQRPGDSVTLHGGEPTALPLDVFEKLLEIIYEVSGRTSIQTNGYAITDEHIKLFKKYKTSVGLSIDGPPELNILRGFPGDPEKQKNYIKRVYGNLEKLVSAGINVSIIAVLHKVNAGSPEAREKMKKWFRELADKYNIRHGRTNPMFDPFENPVTKKYELTPEELGEAFVDFWNFFKTQPDLHWSPYRDVVDQMLGLSVSLCQFGYCDIYSSTSAIAVLPDGSLGTCDRTYGLFITRRIDPPLYIREKILRETECKGCKYWNVCHGGCPMEAPYADWRRKTRFCKAYKMLYEAIERDLRALLPNIILSIDVPDWYEKHRQNFNPFSYILELRSTWRRTYMRQKHIRERILPRQPQQVQSRRDWSHGDAPHGDWGNHGDAGHGDWGNHADG